MKRHLPERLSFSGDRGNQIEHGCISPAFPAHRAKTRSPFRALRSGSQEDDRSGKARSRRPRALEETLERIARILDGPDH